MIYSLEKNALSVIVARDEIFKKKIEYRLNIIFLSILVPYIVYVSPLYSINSGLVDTMSIVLAQAVGMVLISHFVVTAYASVFNSLSKAWINEKETEKELSLISKYTSKIMISDLLIKTLTVFFISSIFLSQNNSFYLSIAFLLFVKIPEIKKAINKKYSEVFFAMIISAATILISISFISLIIVKTIY